MTIKQEITKLENERENLHFIDSWKPQDKRRYEEIWLRLVELRKQQYNIDMLKSIGGGL